MVFAGCLSLETRVDIDADGTADLGLTVLVDLGAIRTFGEMFGEDLSDLEALDGPDLVEEITEGENPCDDIGDVPNTGVEVEEVRDGDRRGITCTVRNVPIAEFSNLDADDGASFEIRQDAEGTSIEIRFPTEGLSQDTDDLGAMLGLTFEELFDLTFVVSAPGRLVEHNGTSTSGSTVTWQITTNAPFLVGDDAVMTAEWSGFAESSDDGGLPLVLILAVILGLIVVAVAAVLIARSTKSGPSPSEPAAPVEPAATPTGPPPPPPTGGTPMPPPPPPPG